MANEIQITGLEELREMAGRVSPRVAHNLARVTVHHIAILARNGMRKLAPQDSGTLRRAILAQRRRGTPTEVVSEVLITHGRGVKNDAWYWHFIERGTVKKAAQPFIKVTVKALSPRVPQIYREEFGRRLEKKLVAEARKMGVK